MNRVAAYLAARAAFWLARGLTEAGITLIEWGIRITKRGHAWTAVVQGGNT